jgi:hypothetical protein
MLSIFIMFSADRLPQLKTTIQCLEGMELYEDCQKILVCDDATNYEPPGWDVIVVPREDHPFCWSKMWRAGVDAAKFDKILYLDSDRILPRHYLTRVNDELKDNQWLFSGNLFNFQDYHDPEIIEHYRDILTSNELRDHYKTKYKDLFVYDPRWQLPPFGPGKGVMSGNVAFTRATFEASGGVDPWFEGHGAYADTDFHMQCWKLGMEFVDMDELELHLKHPKLGEDSEELEFKDIELLSLNNFIYHAKKWDLGYKFPRVIATHHLGLSADFVDRVLARIDSGKPFEPLLS